MYHSTCNPSQKLRYFIHVYVYIFYLYFLLSLCNKLHVCMTEHLGCNWPDSDLSTNTQGSWLSCRSGQPLTLRSLRPGPCLYSRFSIKADCTHKSKEEQQSCSAKLYLLSLGLFLCYWAHSPPAMVGIKS